ncbi:Tripartite motif containing 37 [Irineochytrium annulatum]|nr:Tripartite motif containing 37 [Irineochytrium annulatum]
MDVIKSSDKIIDLISKHPTVSKDIAGPNMSMEFESDIAPNFDSSSFQIRGFKALRENNEVVYSPPMKASGLEWRLKVYCSGNGHSRGEYLSAFVELVKGSKTTSTYQYKIELVRPVSDVSEDRPTVSREFASVFDEGECWGYNRFYRLDLLDREGYFNSSDDYIEIRFHVRAPTYAQRCRDLQLYASALEAEKERAALLQLTTVALDAGSLKVSSAAVEKPMRVSSNGHGSPIQLTVSKSPPPGRSRRASNAANTSTDRAASRLSKEIPELAVNNTAQATVKVSELALVTEDRAVDADEADPSRDTPDETLQSPANVGIELSHPDESLAPQSNIDGVHSSLEQLRSDMMEFEVLIDDFDEKVDSK